MSQAISVVDVVTVTHAAAMQQAAGPGSELAGYDAGDLNRRE